jgi:septal ring factor EnvC (AmiA/AmiB activator)
MTASLLVRVWVFVASAFVLGLAVGWLFWRFHRASVPNSEWRSSQAELTAQRRRTQALTEERDALAGQVARIRGESSHVGGLLTDAWHEREALRARVVELDRQIAMLRDELDHASARARYLQRRVTERSVTEQSEAGLSEVGLSDARRATPPPAALVAPASVDPASR